jgi:hypothetical protein
VFVVVEKRVLWLEQVLVLIVQQDFNGTRIIRKNRNHVGHVDFIKRFEKDFCQRLQLNQLGDVRLLPTRKDALKEHKFNKGHILNSDLVNVGEVRITVDFVLFLNRN